MIEGISALVGILETAEIYRAIYRNVFLIDTSISREQLYLSAAIQTVTPKL